MAEFISVLQSRRFNRYKPYGLERIREENLRFVMFWGALGKKRIDANEIKAIGTLCKFRDEIERKTGKNAKFTLLLADKHAEMNGIDRILTEDYLIQVGSILAVAGIPSHNIGSYWRKYGITSKMINREKKKLAVVNPKLQAQLERSAERHFNGDKEDGWKTYYAMRKTEKDMLEKEFANCIFLTYNNPDYREILPDLPTLYIYANNGSEPPWLPDKK